MSDWRVNLPAHHEGDITLDEVHENQERLARNRTHTAPMVPGGPAREGLALTTGLLLCGRCGRKLTVRYWGKGGTHPAYECNWLHREGLASKACMSVRCDVVDAAIVSEALHVLQPAELALAVNALEELEARDQTLLRQWHMRLERAEYEADLAERRYQEVDPANRLVATTLEQRWNSALQALEAVRQQYADFERQHARAVTPEQKARILALAQDLPRLWQAPTTAAQDRKRMLRMLIKDVTVEKPSAPHQACLHIRWQGGACSSVSVDLPLPPWKQLRYPDGLIEQIRALAQRLPDAQIAVELNRLQLLSPRGKPFTAKMIQWLRWNRRIPGFEAQSNGLTVAQIARQFGVSPNVVYYWIERGIVAVHPHSAGASYRIMDLTPEKESELRHWVDHSRHLHPASNQGVSAGVCLRNEEP